MKDYIRAWAKGLLQAAIGGMATTIGLIAVDPESMSLEAWPKLLGAAAFGAILAVANYLQRSPLPERKRRSSKANADAGPKRDTKPTTTKGP